MYKAPIANPSFHSLFSVLILLFVGLSIPLLALEFHPLLGTSHFLDSVRMGHQIVNSHQRPTTDGRPSNAYSFQQQPQQQQQWQQPEQWQQPQHPPITHRTIRRTERFKETIKEIPFGCEERTIKKITVRRRRKINGIPVEDWSIQIEYYLVDKKTGSLTRISEEEALRCVKPEIRKEVPVVHEEPPEEGPEEMDAEENIPAEKEAAVISRIPSRPPSTDYLDFSDPQNRGRMWCWKLVFRATNPHNFGYLVHYRECVENRMSQFYQMTSDLSVCTKEGGIEVDYFPFEGSTLPYKISCIPRLEALSVDTDSCWRIQQKLPNLVLSRVPTNSSEAEKSCGLKNMAWPFYDGEHVSSRFSNNEGGMSRLYYCNRPTVQSVSVFYHLTPKGIVTGFADTFCIPPSEPPHYACFGVAVKCFYYNPPTSYMS